MKINPIQDNKPFSWTLRVFDHQPEKFDAWLSEGWFPIRGEVLTFSSHQMNYSRETLDRVWGIRLALNSYQTTRSHRRILKKNSDLTLTWAKGHHEFYIPDREQEQLYEKYLHHVTSKLDAYTSIQSCLFGSGITSYFSFNCVQVRLGDKLIAVGYSSFGTQAIACRLNFYDPEFANRSLSKFIILKTIERGQREMYQYLYPGYLVEGSERLAYKTFLGVNQLQALDPFNQKWIPFQEEMLLQKNEYYTEEEMMDVSAGKNYLDEDVLITAEEIDIDSFLRALVLDDNNGPKKNQL